jgi:hypothetical protein
MTRTTREDAVGPGVGAAVVLAGLVALLGWLALDAATAPPPVSIVGYVVAACDAEPSSTVEVHADGELVGAGAVGTWDTAGALCRAAISVNDVESRDTYTVTTGELSATVAQSSLYDTMTIRLWEG